jgi:hypothetical protein
MLLLPVVRLRTAKTMRMRVALCSAYVTSGLVSANHTGTRDSGA